MTCVTCLVLIHCVSLCVPVDIFSHEWCRVKHNVKSHNFTQGLGHGADSFLCDHCVISFLYYLDQNIHHPPGISTQREDNRDCCCEMLLRNKTTNLNYCYISEQEVAHLTDKKQELDKKKLDVVNTESRISESELKLGELTQELNPISEKLNAIVALQKNLVMFQTKKEKIKIRYGDIFFISVELN